MNKEMQIVIVDENDVEIGVKARSNIEYAKDIYRVSCLYVTNSKGEILLAKRHHTKSHDPSKWSLAVAGTVEAGETYESNIYKEAAEELGLSGYTFTLGPKQPHLNYSRKFFAQWFAAVVDKNPEEFVLQEDEVEEVKWVNKEDLMDDVSSNPSMYVESMPSVVDLLLKK